MRACRWRREREWSNTDGSADLIQKTFIRSQTDQILMLLYSSVLYQCSTWTTLQTEVFIISDRSTDLGLGFTSREAGCHHQYEVTAHLYFIHWLTLTFCNISQKLLNYSWMQFGLVWILLQYSCGTMIHVAKLNKQTIILTAAERKTAKIRLADRKWPRLADWSKRLILGQCS